MYLRDRSLFMGGRGPEILGRGPLIFGKSLRGGPLIFGKSLRGGATYFWREKFLKSPRNPFFDTFSYAILGRGPLIFGKSLRGGATYFWQVADGGGHLFLAAAKNKISGPPPINNEPSLSHYVAYLLIILVNQSILSLSGG